MDPRKCSRDCDSSPAVWPSLSPLPRLFPRLLRRTARITRRAHNTRPVRIDRDIFTHTERYVGVRQPKPTSKNSIPVLQRARHMARAGGMWSITSNPSLAVARMTHRTCSGKQRLRAKQKTELSGRVARAASLALTLLCHVVADNSRSIRVTAPLSLSTFGG